MQKAFAPRRVEAMRAHIQNTVDRLLVGVQGKGEMDLIRDFAAPLPSQIITPLLGLPPEDRHQFKAWADDIYAFMGLSAVPLVDRAGRALHSALELTAYLRNVIARIRDAPRDDLLSAMVVTEDQGTSLREDEVIANVIGLLSASHETTTHLIGNSIWTLLRHPNQLQLLRDDPSLICSAVEEFLRFESPTQMVGRRVGEELEVNGQRMLKGQTVALLLGSANRDAQQFSDPERLDITRRQNPHVAFGVGSHFCLGASLARLEAQLAIASIVTRMPALKLACSEPDWRPFPSFRGLNSLSVIF
jgi:pimeloyl-[acyl-carrier protein] synthase